MWTSTACQPPDCPAFQTHPHNAYVKSQARRIGELEAERARLLARLPARQRALIVARQEAAAEGQGSEKWVFPSPILRENAFRERERAAEAEAVGATPGGGRCND
jgi:hypothetical protein